MTRIALLADIHGNLPALDAVLSDLAQFPVDHIVVPGDLVGRGPWTREVVERVVAAGWPLIRGNHELYLLDHDTPRAPESWRNNLLTPWMRAGLGPRWLGAMACWPDTLSLRFPDAPPLRVFHGTPQSAFLGIFHNDPDSKLCELLADVVEDTVVFAHTHLPLDHTVDRWHILNPGSVGLPMDGIHLASYLVLEGDESGWRGIFRRVPFDYDALYDAFEQLDLVGMAGVAGRVVLREFETARPQFTRFLRWMELHHPGEPWSDEHYAAFDRENPWLHQWLPYYLNVGAAAYRLDSEQGTIDLQRATLDDLPAIIDILEEAARWLTERGIRQWRPGSFTARPIAAYIARGEVYLARINGVPAATITVQWEDPVIWGEQPPVALYVHMFAVRRACAGRGLGLRLLRWAEELAAATGKSFVRLDCAATNRALCRYYEGAGFGDRGRIDGQGWSAQRFERAVAV